MKKKLRSSRGMTLTELLVALMIISFIGMALTLGVNNAVKVYRDSSQLYEAETLCGTILTRLEDEFRFGRNIHKNDSGDTVFFNSKLYGDNAHVTLENGKIKIGGKDLFGESAYTTDLMVSDCTVGYAGGQVTITVAVGPNDTGNYAEHTVKVTPINPSDG